MGKKLVGLYGSLCKPDVRGNGHASSKINSHIPLFHHHANWANIHIHVVNPAFITTCLILAEFCSGFVLMGNAHSKCLLSTDNLVLCMSEIQNKERFVVALILWSMLYYIRVWKIHTYISQFIPYCGKLILVLALYSEVQNYCNA